MVSTIVDGLDHAMTASAFTSVSLDPPLVLVCSHRLSRFNSAVLGSGCWGVSILTESSLRASAWLAKKGRPLEGQLDDIAHHRGQNGVALLDGSLAWLECVTTAAIDGGDHTILMGEVTAARLGDLQDPPLLYYRSHYATIVRSDESEKTVYEGEA